MQRKMGDCYFENELNTNGIVDQPGPIGTMFSFLSFRSYLILSKLCPLRRKECPLPPVGIPKEADYSFLREVQDLLKVIVSKIFVFSLVTFCCQSVLLQSVWGGNFREKKKSPPFFFPSLQKPDMVSHQQLCQREQQRSMQSMVVCILVRTEPIRQLCLKLEDQGAAGYFRQVRVSLLSIKCNGGALCVSGLSQDTSVVEQSKWGEALRCFWLNLLPLQGPLWDLTDSVTSLGKMFPFDCRDGEKDFLLFITLFLIWKATLIKEKMMVIGG